MKTEYQNTVIEKLRKIREEQKFSQAHIARTLGISPGQLGNIESCKRDHKYTLKHIYSLSKLFNVPIETIFINDKDISKLTTEKLIEQIIRYQDDKEEN